jgi:drug/metabolite transporter (DMT)-like permease
MTKNSNLLVLLALGLVWSSFAMFTKIAATVFSPAFIVFSRLFIGGLFLYSVCLYQKKPVFLKKNLKTFALIGIFNSAIPFTLFAFAAKNLDSSILTILEGTIPMFEVLITILILKKHVANQAIFGVVLGVIGAIITSINLSENFQLSSTYIFSILAILLATTCFASSSIFIRSKSENTPAIVNAAGSVLTASFFLSPVLFFTDLTMLNDLKISSALLVLGLFCTGVAYLFYFKLIAEEGSRFAVTYSLLIPIFGTILGTVFMGEELTINKIIGCALIIISIKFITMISLRISKSSPPNNP